MAKYTEEKRIFDEARIAYRNLIGGAVRGLNTEFEYFISNNRTKKDWRECLSLLLPAIKAEHEHRAKKERANKFVPEPKNFKTWIYTRWFEVQYGPSTEQQHKTDAGRIKKKRAEQREGYGPFYNGKSTEELQSMMSETVNNKHVPFFWLMQEILEKRR